MENRYPRHQRAVQTGRLFCHPSCPLVQDSPHNRDGIEKGREREDNEMATYSLRSRDRYVMKLNGIEIG